MAKNSTYSQLSKNLQINKETFATFRQFIVDFWYTFVSTPNNDLEFSVG